MADSTELQDITIARLGITFISTLETTVIQMI